MLTIFNKERPASTLSVALVSGFRVQHDVLTSIWKSPEGLAFWNDMTGEVRQRSPRPRYTEFLESLNQIANQYEDLTQRLEALQKFIESLVFDKNLAYNVIDLWRSVSYRALDQLKADGEITDEQLKIAYDLMGLCRAPTDAFPSVEIQRRIEAFKYRVNLPVRDRVFAKNILESLSTAAEGVPLVINMGHLHMPGLIEELRKGCQAHSLPFTLFERMSAREYRLKLWCESL